MDNKISRIKKILSILACSIFFSFLGVMLIAGILEEDREISESENRVLASFPSFTVSSLTDGSFMTKFEQYLSDQFYGRDKIVSTKTVISRLLGKTEINGVYLGKDNRLFEVPSEIDSDKILKTISAVNSFSENSEIENQYFILSPNASSVYSQYLPDYLKLTQQETQIEEIYSLLNTDIKKINAYGALKNAENEKDLYFRTDHHWTSDAAMLVFAEFMNAADILYAENDYERIVLSDSFYGTLSSSSGIYEKADILTAYLPKNIDGSYYLQNFGTLEKSVSVIYPEKLKEKNQYEVFFGGNFSRIQIQTENLNSKKLLIFKDSYANCFIPLLIPHFEKIVVIDPRYFNDELSYILQDNDFTHLLFLYNLNTFAEDSLLSDVLM